MKERYLKFRAAVDAADFALTFQRLQIAPDGRFGDAEAGAEFGDGADAAVQAVQNQPFPLRTQKFSCRQFLIHRPHQARVMTII